MVVSVVFSFKYVWSIIMQFMELDWNTEVLFIPMMHETKSIISEKANVTNGAKWLLWW